MFKYNEHNNPGIILHDCCAKKIYFENGMLSFALPDGFWILPGHPCNVFQTAVRTGAAQVDFQLSNSLYENPVEISVFRKNGADELVCEKWEPEAFVKAVNAGDFYVEFVDEYESWAYLLFKCCLWRKKTSLFAECEIILHGKEKTCRWNDLRSDCYW